jgi:hypothetical protein
MRLPRKLPRPDAFLALLALLAACKMASPRSGPERSRSGATTSSGAVAAPFEVTSDNLASFRALQSALEEDEDELATRIVATLRGRKLSAREKEIAASAEKVLAGRALVRALDLRLESEAVPERAGSFRLVLVARSDARADVCLRLPPCDLKRLRASMDPLGAEGLQYDSRATGVLSELVLAPTVERRIEVLAYELPLGRALGVRERWRLEPRSGAIESGGKSYPAAKVRVEGCERERLSPLLPGEPSLAEALAAALDAPQPSTPRTLLELALRTPQDAREPALRALAPVVARLARVSPARVADAEPALRWLTENRDLGPDAQAWARYLEARARADAVPAGAPAGGLDLPVRRGGEGM